MICPVNDIVGLRFDDPSQPLVLTVEPAEACLLFRQILSRCPELALERANGDTLSGHGLSEFASLSPCSGGPS